MYQSTSIGFPEHEKDSIGGYYLPGRYVAALRSYSHAKRIEEPVLEMGLLAAFLGGGIASLYHSKVTYECLAEQLHGHNTRRTPSVRYIPKVLFHFP